EKNQTGVVREDRKLAPQLTRVEPPSCPVHRGGKGGGSWVDRAQARRRHSYSSNIAKRRASRDSKCSRRAAGPIGSSASPTKASISIRRASSWPMPRAFI